MSCRLKGRFHHFHKEDVCCSGPSKPTFYIIVSVKAKKPRQKAGSKDSWLPSQKDGEQGWLVAQEVQKGSSTRGEGTAVQALVFSPQPQILPLQVTQNGVGTIGTQALLLRGCYVTNVSECSFTVRL